MLQALKKQNSSRIKAVIFDYNGIFMKSIDRQILANASRKLKANLFLSMLSYLYHLFVHQTGRMDSFTFWKKVFFTARKPFTEKEFKELVIGYYMKNEWLDNKMFELTEKLKSKGIKTVLLSNSGNIQSKENKAAKRYELFDKIFLSDEMHVVKPFPKAFRQVFDYLKAKPKECLFVDDQIQNVLAAKLLGLKSIWYFFNSSEKLEEKLKKMSVL